MERKTPLYDRHRALSGKMAPYAGHLLPVEYAGIIKEHMAVRTACGLFDVSHMGEISYKGKDALANIQKIVTNDCAGMKIGQVRYSPMCNERGGVVDDLLVYRKGEDAYLLVVNAANREKDVNWMRTHLFGDCALEDLSGGIAQLALQGPRALKVFEKLSARENIPGRAYRFIDGADVAGISCLVSRTGYTGEDGLELYCAAEDAAKLWDALLAAGADEGLIPCGLGARDTLRLEAGMPLYGHEMSEEITPLEAGLSMFVKPDKGDFIGKAALIGRAPERMRAGLRILGRGIARENCPIYADGRMIGATTSGTHLPYLGHAAAMALVETGAVRAGARVEVEIRGRRVEAEVVPLPFYRRK
jgi:aminomethyltransferase